MKRPRKRDSIEDDEDERALDAILIELGIPNHDKKIKAAPSASAQVIELITPPRNFSSTASREQSDGLSYVDLTASPASLSRSPSPPNVYRDTSSHTVAAVNDDEQQLDEVSFSYSPSECPPSYVYSLSPEPDLSSSSSSSLEVLSPELSLAVRRQVVANKGARTGAKQARRLSGRLRNLHSEATRGSRQGRDDKKVTIREAPTIAAALSSARTTTIPSVKSTAGASLLQSSTSGKQGQDGIVAAVIAVVQMEKSLDTSIAGEKIRKALKSHVYNGKAVPFTVATALKCTVPGVIRWERRGSGDPHYSCAIYYEAGAYLKVLQKKSYTELIAVVRYLQTLIPWMELQTKRPRPLQEEDDCSKIFIIVEGMDRALIGLKERQIQEQKKGSTTSRHDSAVITFADLQEVAFQLFMDMGTHTKFTSDLDDTADYIALLTRELVLASSRVSALEEFLEAVPRYNSFRVTQTGATTSACANAWLRMLLVIPGVSEDKAQCLLDHFPTFDSLMQAYRDPNLSRAQKQNLVADKLSDARIQRALSKRIYTVFCEENPDTLL